jgi:hypothetical protein
VLTPASPAADWLAVASPTTGYGTTPTYINSNGTSLSVNIPEDAVSGVVTIVQPMAISCNR